MNSTLPEPVVPAAALAVPVAPQPPTALRYARRVLAMGAWASLVPFIAFLVAAVATARSESTSEGLPLSLLLVFSALGLSMLGLWVGS